MWLSGTIVTMDSHDTFDSQLLSKYRLIVLVTLNISYLVIYLWSSSQLLCVDLVVNYYQFDLIIVLKERLPILDV